MSKHYNRILELKLRLLEEPGEETFLVPHVKPANVGMRKIKPVITIQIGMNG